MTGIGRSHGGFDLYFTFDPVSNSSILVETDSLVRPLGESEGGGDANVEIGLEMDNGIQYIYVKLYQGTTLVEKSNFPLK